MKTKTTLGLAGLVCLVLLSIPLYRTYEKWQAEEAAKAVAKEEANYRVSEAVRFQMEYWGDQNQYLLVIPDADQVFHDSITSKTSPYLTGQYLYTDEYRIDTRLDESKAPAPFSEEEYFRVFIYDTLRPDAPPLR
ncbi:hypothetical protein ACEE16_10455 [Streptococcus suis]